MPFRAVSNPRTRSRRIASVLWLFTAVASQLLLVAPVVEAGTVYPNPPNATPIGWPSSFTSYTSDTGTPISDVEGEAGVGSVYDISSSGGAATSVFLAVSGGTAFFRVRVGANPVDITKGGFDNATWLVLLATQDTPGVWTTKAVTGVDGKPVGSVAAPDTVYVGNAPGTGITDVYQFNTAVPAFNPLGAIGTGARVVAASATQYFIDWQVPVSTLTTVSGGNITAATPVRLFFGSSAAANLATINKDYMTGGAISFANLATVTLSPPTLTLTQSKSLVSGPNPPHDGTASVYDVVVTAQNTGASSLFSPSITIVMPAGISIVSQTTTTGSVLAVGQTVIWTPGTMLSGAATINATIRVSVTPGLADVGTTMTIANAAAGTGSDGTATINGTGTAQTVGPVLATPHATTTTVSCPAGAILYGGTKTCTVTVTDTSGSPTVPTGTVAMSGVLGSSTACTLAAATASSANCTVTFTATGVGAGSLSGAYSGDSTHAVSNGSSAGFTISQAPLSVSTVAATRVYGDPNPTFSASFTGFVNGDDAADLGGILAFSTSATTASPVGTYAVTPSGLTSTNYAFTYAPQDLTITKASLTITANDAARDYGVPNPTFTATYGGFVNGDDAGDLDTPPSLATTALISSAPGDYPITVSGATSTNYDITVSAGTLTVGQTSLTVTVDPVSKTYGDPNPTFTVSFSGFVNGDTVADLGGTLACSTAATGSSDAGPYAVTCGGYTSGDYAIVFVGGTLTIDPAVLTVSPDPQSRDYGAPNPALTVGFSGFVNGDTIADLAGAPACSTAAIATSPAGTYPISCLVGSLANANYTFDLSGTADLTVEPADLTVTVDPATKTYGDPNPAFTVSFGGFANGETVADLGGTLVFTTAAGSGSGVGGYTVSASGLTSSNYAITFADGSLAVTKATLTVTPVDTAVPTGDPIPTSWAVDLAGFVNGDDETDVSGAAACSTDAVAGDPAGPYTITCTVGTLSAANYDFIIGGTGLFTIGTVTLTVTVDPVSKTYGDPNPTFTVSFSGFVNGDTVADLGGTLACSTAATGSSDAGPYAVTCGGYTSGDYAVVFVGGTLTIDPAVLTVSPDPQSRDYGAPNPALTVGFSGFVNGDTIADLAGAPACSTAAIATSPAGTYPISCLVGSLANANYTFDLSGTADLTVEPADLTVTVDPATKTYGDPNPAFTVSFGGFANGETVADLGGTLVFATTATASSPAGSYTVSASGFVHADYVFDYQDGWLTIEPAGQSIAFAGLPGATFGDGTIDLTATSTSGLTVSFTTTGPCSVSGTTLTITGAGTCIVTAHQAGDTNHDAAPDVSQSLVVAKATPTVTWADPADITYGTPLSGTQLDALASVPGSFVYSPVAGIVLGAGTYTLFVMFTPTDSANYTSVTSQVEITVTKADQVITFGPLPDATDGDGPVTLDGTSSSGLLVTYTATGACTVSGSTVTITGPGTCTITAHQAGNADVAPADPVTVSFAVEAGASPASSSIVLDRTTVSQGGKVHVTAAGFRPGTEVDIWLGSVLVATAVADAGGVVSVWITIPASSAVGWHDVAAIGIDPAGGMLSLTSPLNVIDIPDTSAVDGGSSRGGFIPLVGGLLLLLLAAMLAVPAHRRRRLEASR